MRQVTVVANRVVSRRKDAIDTEVETNMTGTFCVTQSCVQANAGRLGQDRAALAYTDHARLET